MNVTIAKKNHPQYIGLSNTGQFVKFRHRMPLQIGEQIEIKQNTFRISPRLVAGIAAAMVLTSASVFGYAYNVPVSYLYVDINPSIELAVNYFDRVISAKGLNTDGESVIIETSLNHNSAEASVEKIIEKAIEKGYMADNLENVVLLNTTGDDKTLEKIKEKINKFTSSGKLENIHPEMQIERVNKTQVEQARIQHISAGKLKLIEKATLENSALTKEQLADMSVRDIVKQIKTNRIKEKPQDSKDINTHQSQETLKKNSNLPTEPPSAKNNSSSVVNKAPQSVQKKQPIKNNSTSNIKKKPTSEDNAKFKKALPRPSARPTMKPSKPIKKND